MIKRGKFFIPPLNDGRDFKELFKDLMAKGAGRPADKDGLPVGPWTAELLAKAISDIDANKGGIELRTVQHWFQDNDKGISADNIRWLARIFGCGDPNASSAWQAELSAANRRLVAKRRKGRETQGERASQSNDVSRAVNSPSSRLGLARASDAIFGGSPLNLPSLVFAGAVALGFMSYFLGIHKVTFDTPNGLSKQVGFLWAPNWTLLFLVFMPLFFASVADLLGCWKDEGRKRLLPPIDRNDSSNTWASHLEASTYTFWTVLLICLLFAGIIQWVGVRLLPLLRGGGNYAIDWGSLAIMRPDIVSVPEAIIFTGFAYLYMCICFYLFFAGLILLFSVSQDYGRMLDAHEPQKDAILYREATMVGDRVIQGTFRSTVLAVFVAICMKLQSSYLSSSGTDILSWLIGDMTSIFNERGISGSLGDYRAPNHFSSLLIVLAAVFVFLYGISRLEGSAPAECRMTP